MNKDDRRRCVSTQVRPIGERVLVKPDERPTQTASGLHLAEDRKPECSGVVVSCAGTRHTGYVVSMLFTGMNPQSRAQLSLLAHS